MAVDLRPDQIRRDGQARAGAQAGWRGVILSFDCRHGALSYPCDTFEARWHGQTGWQANTRAIALGLEALRQVDRYGISAAGQQYRGFRQLGTGDVGNTDTTGFSSVEEAARFLIRHGLGDDRQDSTATVPDVGEVIGNQALLGRLYRQAARRLHPDAGGDENLFKRLSEARDMVAGAR